MKGTLGVLFALTSAISWEDEDVSCVYGLPNRSKQHLIKKKTGKTKGKLSAKTIERRTRKKVRQRRISKARESLENKRRLYEQTNTSYVKSHGRLERHEDKFSDTKFDKYQWEDVPLHGPHKEGVIPRHAYEISMWYKSLMKPPQVKPQVKRLHRVYYGSELVLLTQSPQSIAQWGQRVSWADDNNQKLVSKYIPGRKPVNCHLAHRDCFMRMKCYCMYDDPNKKPIMNSLNFNK